MRLIRTPEPETVITDAARCTTKSSPRTPDDNEKLIRYLMRNGHMSPFEFQVYSFHIKCPIFVARQFFRYRTGKYAERSGRYTTLLEYYVPEPNRIKRQSTSNKQGSSTEGYSPEISKDIRDKIFDTLEYAMISYEELLELGVAKELARIVLPLSVYTDFYWQMDLRNILNFLEQRLDEHAQEETKRYALAISEIVRCNSPVTMRAFEEKLDMLLGKKF